MFSLYDITIIEAKETNQNPIRFSRKLRKQSLHLHFAFQPQQEAISRNLKRTVTMLIDNTHGRKTFLIIQGIRTEAGMGLSKESLHDEVYHRLPKASSLYPA